MLAFIGLFVGAFGTLIGVAGGFLLVPILLFLYPGDSPAAITSTTLTVAFFNAFSGTIAYGRQRRVDWRSGLYFAITGVPGAILGAYITGLLSRGVFQYIFGAILLVVAGYLLLHPERRMKARFLVKWPAARIITDSQQNTYAYLFNLPMGMLIAFFVGVVSGMLGIGGGIIHVPVLTQVLGFPTHVATATSHFSVAMTTFTADITHIISGTFTADVGRVLVLSAGAVIGAQFGARLSQRVTGILIVRLLAIGLAIVAIRLLVAPL